MLIERHHLTRFACVFGLVFLMASMFNPPSRASLLMWFSSGKVDGSITRAADPSNHNYLSYEYAVRGKTYSGTGYGPIMQIYSGGNPQRCITFPPRPRNQCWLDRTNREGMQHSAFS